MTSIDLTAAVRQSALGFLAKDARIAVALSGGVDSVVLLHLLAALRSELTLQLQAVHVNHGLSPNADAWEKFCFDACATLGIAFVSLQLGLAPENGKSLEALARNARYSALEGAAKLAGARIIALAQHADDQAETVMLQLLRGAGAKGLAAMPEWRENRNGCAYWRPLLQTTRHAIVDYAHFHGLHWIEDESNANTAFKRNFLRAQVLPPLERGFPGYRTSLARTAAHAAETVQLLDQLADLDAATATVGDRLALAALRPLGTLRVKNLLRRYLAQRGIAVPTGERLAEFIRQTFEAANDRHPALKLQMQSVLRANGGYIAIERAAASAHFLAAWAGEKVVVLPHGSLHFKQVQGTGIRASMIPITGFVIRPRAGGERLRLAANRPLRTFKNLMQEAGVPASMRSQWPLLVHDGRLVAVPGIGVNMDWQCQPEEPGWAVEWLPRV